MPVSVPRLYGAVMASDIAPVAAIPTTASHFSLWNGESPGGKIYTITSIGFTQTTSAAAVIIQQLLVHLCPGTQPLIAGTAVKGPVPMDGNPIRDTKAQVVQAVTLTAGQAAASFWHPVGLAVNSSANTAVIGLGSWVNTAGLYQLAPGSILSMAVLCSAAASAKNTISVTWSEA